MGAYVTIGGGGAYVTIENILDDAVFPIGSDGDGAITIVSAGLAADTALTGVLIGTPDTPALAANSLIISNITADGDILIAGNDGGHSKQALFFDSSAAILHLGLAGTPSLSTAGMVYCGGILEVAGVAKFATTVDCYASINVRSVASSLTVFDDAYLGLGAGNDALLVYETADANAKCLQWRLPSAAQDANNVPVLALLGAAGITSDLGLFTGFVQPMACVVDADADSWFGITFSADDTPQLACGGAAAAIANGIKMSSYVGMHITDTDGTVEGQLWYDASEDKLKFKTAAGVETITSA